MYNLETSKLINLLPPNYREDPDMIAASQAIDKDFIKIVKLAKECIILPRIDELKDEVLDLLAWQMHVDFYDVTFATEIKRKLIKNSMKWHKRKGTPSAVEELITTLFGDGKVEEWFEYNGAPFTFRVITNNEEVTNERAIEFTKALESVKNMRSWLDKVVITFSESMEMNFAGAIHTADKITIKQVV